MNQNQQNSANDNQNSGANTMGQSNLRHPNNSPRKVKSGKTQVKTTLEMPIINKTKIMQASDRTKAKDLLQTLLNVRKSFLDPVAVELLSNAGTLTLPLIHVRNSFTVVVTKTETTSRQKQNVQILVHLL